MPTANLEHSMRLCFPFGRNLRALFPLICRPANVAVLMLISCTGAFAQQLEIQPVSLVLNATSGETTFSRPRKVSSPSTGDSKVATTKSFSLEEATTLERTAFDLTNDARIARGLSPLNWDAELCRLARHHSEDMARRGYFDHETPEGLLPKARARAVGYRFRVIAENIAYNKGYQDPAGVAVSRWMKSSGHRENILFNEFQYSAIGSYVAPDGTVYLTQVFTSR